MNGDFYPSGNNFTLAVLVMLVTNIISASEHRILWKIPIVGGKNKERGNKTLPQLFIADTMWATFCCPRDLGAWNCRDLSGVRHDSFSMSQFGRSQNVHHRNNLCWNAIRKEKGSKKKTTENIMFWVWCGGVGQKHFC